MRAKVEGTALVCAWEWRDVIGLAVVWKLTAMQQIPTDFNVHGLLSISSFLTVTE